MVFIIPNVRLLVRVAEERSAKLPTKSSPTLPGKAAVIFPR